MTRIWMPSRYAVRCGDRSTPVSRTCNAALWITCSTLTEEHEERTYTPVLLLQQSCQFCRPPLILLGQESAIHHQNHGRHVWGLETVRKPPLEDT